MPHTFISCQETESQNCLVAINFRTTKPKTNSPVLDLSSTSIWNKGIGGCRIFDSLEVLWGITYLDLLKRVICVPSCDEIQHYFRKICWIFCSNHLKQRQQVKNIKKPCLGGMWRLRCWVSRITSSSFGWEQQLIANGSGLFSGLPDILGFSSLPPKVKHGTPLEGWTCQPCRHCMRRRALPGKLQVTPCKWSTAPGWARCSWLFVSWSRGTHNASSVVRALAASASEPKVADVEEEETWGCLIIGRTYSAGSDQNLFIIRISFPSHWFPGSGGFP